jgi:putative phosphoesterase
MIKIGVLSDTHGYLDRQILEIFKGVDHIIHAGDIGYPSLILELEEIAPVTAVVGNNDEGTDYRETETVVLDGRKFLIYHQLDPHSPPDKIKRRIIRENPDVVVFGHTHKKFCETIGQTLFFNPGYAGKPRFGHARSVAVLLCDNTGITAEFRELTGPPMGV